MISQKKVLGLGDTIIYFSTKIEVAIYVVLFNTQQSTFFFILLSQNPCRSPTSSLLFDESRNLYPICLHRILRCSLRFCGYFRWGNSTLHFRVWPSAPSNPSTRPTIIIIVGLVKTSTIFILSRKGRPLLLRANVCIPKISDSFPSRYFLSN